MSIGDYDRDIIIRAFQEKMISIFQKEFDERLERAVKTEVKSQLSLILKDMSRLAGMDK